MSHSPSINTDKFRQKMLAWYDTHQRDMPWRAHGGKAQDPYKVWLSEVMLQQTTVATVAPYYAKFIKRWPTLRALASAPADDVLSAWAGLGYYTRARNLHACAKKVMADYKGRFPTDYAALKALPGIGDYTASSIRAIAFGLPAVVVDGNVERVVARLFDIRNPLPGAKRELHAAACALAQGRTDRPGCFAQAMMDLGSAICVPAQPRCGQCPVRAFCAGHAAGTATGLPARAAKKPLPARTGTAYWITNKRGDVLVERRPDTGMLPGMDGLPTSAWGEEGDAPRPAPPVWLKGVKTVDAGIAVRHVFSHFSLTLAVRRGVWVGGALPLPLLRWVPPGRLAGAALPKLFQKIIVEMVK